MDTINLRPRILFTTLLSLIACAASSLALADGFYLKPSPSCFTPSLEAGVMAGYTGGPRKGNVINAATGGSVTESGSQDSSEIGAQLRLLFGSEYNARPFIYLNGVRPIGTPLMIRMGEDLPPFTTSTRLSLTNNWLGRLGVGAATPWLYEQFQIGIGAAAVVMNQTLTSYIGEATVQTFKTNKTSVRPSVMGSVTWSLCEKCIKCHELLLTAQITADNNPVINASVPSEVGTLNTRVNQAWVPRGDLILSVKLF